MCYITNSWYTNGIQSEYRMQFMRGQKRRSRMEAFKLTGKNAIVTGAGAGLGNSIAAGLAEAGAKVALIDIRPDIGEIAAGMSGDGMELVGVRADLMNRDICTSSIKV